MHKTILLARVVLAAAFALFSAPASAQSAIYTPKAGSAERKAIMNALRGPVQKDLAYNASPGTNGKGVKIAVVFKIVTPTTDLRVDQGWAFVYAVLCHPNGVEIDYDTPIATALLHRVSGVWRVVTHETGGDLEPLPWADWSKKYHAPAELFPKS